MPIQQKFKWVIWESIFDCVLKSLYLTIYSYYAFCPSFFSFIGLLLSHQNLLRLIQYFCTTLYPLTLKGFLTPLFSWLNVSLLSFWDSHSYLLHAFITTIHSRPLFYIILLICLSIQFLECFLLSYYCNFQLEKGRWRWFFTVQIFFSIWIVTTAPFCQLCLLLQSYSSQATSI